MCSSFILKGIFCHTPEKDRLEIRKNASAVCLNGICEGIFDEVPERFRDLEVIDCTDQLVLPGMVDLHIHAPQYSFIGTGMDYELLEWLNRKTFPEEVKYQSDEYADQAYRLFSAKMQRSATTRALIFGTVHRRATLMLMSYMESTGLISYVGKVNMDRNAPKELLEADSLSDAENTRLFLIEARWKGFCRTKPILTPRFVVTCTDDLMKKLGKLRSEYGLPVQSHLSENPEELELVRSLEPDSRFYGDVYDRWKLFGGEARTVMAHCVYSTPEEAELIRKNGVWVAHCPLSNMNLSSGIAPIRRYLDMGIRVGLGTDVGAGSSESLFNAVTDAVKASKLYTRYIDSKAKALSFSESFYLATKGGGSFFGKVGSFEKGYEFDALVLDDLAEHLPELENPADRLERAFYLGLDQKRIVRKYAAGKEIRLSV